jgi:hypothetical protein
MTRLDRSDVIAHAMSNVPSVIRALAIKGRECAGQWRTTICPVRGGVHSRDACTISMESGQWLCFVCNKGGDLAALVASCYGLDGVREFPAVLERLAELSGHVPSADPREAQRLRSEMERRETERRALETASNRERNARARVDSAGDWARCSPRSPEGEAYARSRGLGELFGRDVFRFGARGEIAIPLHAADGAIVNVVRRNLPGTEPKVYGKRDCPTLGTFGHSLADIAGGRDVALVEGVIDSVTARMLWPDAVILGAHGASNLPKLAPHVAKRAALARARLYLVPHLDSAGIAACSSAGLTARHHGLTFGESLHVISLRDGTTRFKDLNEAHCTGWRESLADAAVRVHRGQS